MSADDLYTGKLIVPSTCSGLSATLSAASSLSATLCYAIPWRALSLRLAKSGAALAAGRYQKFRRMGASLQKDQKEEA